MTTASNKKPNKTEEHQMEMAGELGRAAALAIKIISDKEQLTPRILAEVLTSLPDEEDEDEFLEIIQKDMPKAHELAAKIFGIVSTLEGAVAVALRMPEDADDEDLEVFVEDFTFAVEAIKNECKGAVDIAATCAFFDELNQ